MKATVEKSQIQRVLEHEEKFLKASRLFLDGFTHEFHPSVRIQHGLTITNPRPDEKMDYIRLDSMTLTPTEIELKALRAFAEARAFNMWAELYKKDPKGYEELFLSPPCVGEQLFPRTMVLRKRYPALGGWVWRDHRDWMWVPMPGMAMNSLKSLYLEIFHAANPDVTPDVIYADRVVLWESVFEDQYRAIMEANVLQLELNQYDHQIDSDWNGRSSHAHDD